MENNTLALKVSKKRNKYIFLLTNIAIILPAIIHNFSNELAIVAGVLIAIQLGVILKGGDSSSAGSLISFFLFSDFIIALTALVCAWITSDYELPEKLLRYYQDWYLLPIIIGCILFLFKGWIADVAGSILTFTVLMMVWNKGDILSPDLTTAGKTVVLLTTLLMVVWYVACQLTRNDKDFKKAGAVNKWLGVLLFASVAAINILGYEILETKAWLIAAWVRDTIPTFFVWWKIVLATLILVVFAVTMFDFEKDVATPDTEICLFLAFGILLLKVMALNYFAHNWCVFLAFLVGSFCCMRKNGSNEKMLRLAPVRYHLVQFVVLLASVLAIRNGLVLNVVISIVFLIIFYNLYDSRIKDKHKPIRWVMILVCAAAETVAFVWAMRFHEGRIAMLAMSLVVASFSLCILNIEDAKGNSAEQQQKIILCTMMGLICLCVACPGGSVIKYSIDEDGNTIIISADARGKNNEVDSLEVFCEDEVLDIKTRPQDAGNGIQAEITPLGATYTSIVTDVNGVKTTKSFWIPTWMDQWLSTEQYKPEAPGNWKDAFVEKLSQYEMLDMFSGEEVFYLLYVDDDDDPEIWIDYMDPQYEVEMWSFHRREVEVLSPDSKDSDSQVSYIKRSGLFKFSFLDVNDEGAECVQEYYYNLGNGRYSLVDKGSYQIEEDEPVEETITWNKETCSWETYEELSEIAYYGFGNVIELDEGYSLDELLSILAS